jgi:hypothetical protein
MALRVGGGGEGGEADELVDLAESLEVHDRRANRKDGMN